MDSNKESKVDRIKIIVCDKIVQYLENEAPVRSEKTISQIESGFLTSGQLNVLDRMYQAQIADCDDPDVIINIGCYFNYIHKK
jgi:hypothetical protein